MKTVDADGTAHFKGHDIRGEQKAKEILRRLKFDNDTIHKAVSYTHLSMVLWKIQYYLRKYL